MSEMNVIALKIQRTPYTYILEWTAHNVRYIGARWAKGCHPTDLWSRYFTSSEYVREFVEIHGEPDVILIDQTFSDPQEAMAREMELLRKYDAAKSPNFLNKNIQGIYDINDPDIRRRNSASQVGRKKSPESIEKMRKSRLGKKASPETRAKMSAARKGKPIPAARGRKHTPEWIAWVTEFHRTRKRSAETGRRISEAKKGKSQSPEHKASLSRALKGLKRSPEVIARMKAASPRLKNKIVTCPHCGKVGGEGGMVRWHFENCKSRP
jgi:hypothetical protein